MGPCCQTSFPHVPPYVILPLTFFQVLWPWSKYTVLAHAFHILNWVRAKLCGAVGYLDIEAPFFKTNNGSFDHNKARPCLNSWNTCGKKGQRIWLCAYLLNPLVCCAHILTGTWGMCLSFHTSSSSTIFSTLQNLKISIPSTMTSIVLTFFMFRHISKYRRTWHALCSWNKVGLRARARKTWHPVDHLAAVLRIF